MNNDNKSREKLARLNGGLWFCLTLILSIYPAATALSNDLLQGNDLLDSTLSSSINKQVAISINGESRLLLVSQYGISNQAIVSQKGAGVNGLRLVQNGIGNVAVLIQDGIGNQINLEQNGLNNYANVVQKGDKNTVNLLQAGERRFTVHQIGNGLTVNITQN